jgi:hypothetical protein
MIKAYPVYFDKHTDPRDIVEDTVKAAMKGCIHVVHTGESTCILASEPFTLEKEVEDITEFLDILDAGKTQAVLGDGRVVQPVWRDER